jgi:hypothetical protein
VEDCGTSHTVKVKIKNKDILGRLEGRHYVEDNEIKTIDADDESLVNETIKLRSPETCAIKDGVCKTCYGKNLAKLNKDIHIGILAVLTLTNQLTQRLLSSKHLLQTNSKELNFHNKFKEYFLVNKNIITFESDKKNTLVIDRDNLRLDDENSMLYIDEMTIKERGKEFNIDLPTKLYLTDEMVEKVENYEVDDVSYIPTKVLKNGTDLFSFIMQNRGLTKPLTMIQDLIGKNDHLGFKTINSITQKFLELLGESGIHLQSVHAELILKELLRSKDDILSKPDFSEDSEPEYKILRVKKALLKSPSITKSLSFERHKQQLLDPDTYIKNEESIYDFMFGRD